MAASSLKAALDLDWADPEQRQRGLEQVLLAWEGVQEWLDSHPQEADRPGVAASMAVARQVREQDVQAVEGGRCRLREGVARDRRISVEDAQMRHGRKSRRQLFAGYKRHVLRDLGSGLVRAVTPANVPEAAATDAIMADLGYQDVNLVQLHIDRAYLPSRLVRERPEGLAGPQRQAPAQDGLSHGLGARAAHLPEPGDRALPAGRGGAFPPGHLRLLQPAGPMHQQLQGPQRQHPPR